MNQQALINTEGVCVCSHLIEDHMLGPCSRCLESPCMFFVLRFWREVGFVAPRQNIPDPIGHYWRMYAPKGSTAWIYSQMTEEDRLEVASECFRDAQFNTEGEIVCIHQGIKPSRIYHGKNVEWCEEEYMCEVLASLILMGEKVFEQDLTTLVLRRGEKTVTPDIIANLARTYAVEHWAVRFRIILLGHPTAGNSV